MEYKQLNSEGDETISSREAYSTNGWKVEIGEPNKSNARAFKVELLAPSSRDAVLSTLFLISIIGILVGLLLRFLGKNNATINAGSAITIITAFIFGSTIALCHCGTTTSYSITYFYKRYITIHDNISIVDWRSIPVEFHEHFALLMNVYYTRIVTLDGAKHISFQEKERSRRETAIVAASRVVLTLVGISFGVLAVLMLRYAIPFVIGDNGTALAGVILCFSGNASIVACVRACWSVWKPSCRVQTPEIEIEFCAENRNKIICGTIKTLPVVQC